MERSLVTIHPANLQMANLGIEEMILFRNLTKIGTDEIKQFTVLCFFCTQL